MNAILPAPPTTSPRRSGLRATDAVLCTALALGAAITAFGWFSAPPGTWHTASHLDIAAWTFVAMLPVAVVLARLRLARPLPAALAGAAAFAALTGDLGAVLATAAFAWSSTVLGRLVGRRQAQFADRDALLIGLCVHGTLVGASVQWPIHYVGTHVALLAAPLLCAPRTARDVLARAWHWATAERTARWTELAAATAVAAVAAVHYAAALMPELGHDALAMHLLLPSRIAADHHWAFDVERYVWTFMPALGDWVYTIGYLLAGETGARVFNLGAVLLLAHFVYELARWAGGGAVGAMAAALLFLCTPLALIESNSLFVDAVWSCLLVGGAFALFAAFGRGAAAANGERDHATADALLAAGVLLGGALAAKAVTFLALPVLGAVMLWHWRRWAKRALLADGLLALAAFAAVGCGPYLRAFVATGNPVFPFFNGVFRSPAFPPSDFEAPAVFDRGTTWDVLYRITFESSRFLEARPGAAGFHWLLLVAPVALALVANRHRRGLLLLGVGALFAWLTFRQTAYLRYVIPTFVLATAAVGAVLGGALPLARATRAALTAATLVAVWLGLACFDVGYAVSPRTRVLFDAAARRDHVDRWQPVRAAVRLVDELNTARAPVAFFAPPFAAGLRADALFSSWYNWRFQNAVRDAGSADAIGALLAREGAQYLIVADAWAAPAEVRQQVLDASTSVRALAGGVDVRELRAQYLFADELLRDPDLTDATAWHVHEGARLDEGGGATVTAAAPATQRVDVVPGRLHRLAVRVRSAGPAAAQARLQVNWLDARGELIDASIDVRECGTTAAEHTIDLVAPAAAASAVVHACGHGAEPVVFERVSFRR